MTAVTRRVCTLDLSVIGSALPGTDSDRDSTFAEQFLSEVVRRLAAVPGLRGSEILIKLRGLDPMYLGPVLAHLAGDHACHDVDDTVSKRAKAALAALRHFDIGMPADTDAPLPTPHPLDFDWRFDTETRRRLTRTVLHAEPQTVLLLGCPTLAVDLLHTTTSAVVLVDDNPALTNLEAASRHRPTASFSQVRADLHESPTVTFGIDADLVVADPPFYSDVITGFLAAAAFGSRVGAQLLIVLPSPFTRPGAAADVDAVLRQTRKAGYKLTDLAGSAVSYVRPPFEAAAHVAAGLPGAQPNWRTADLATFTLETRTAPPLPVTPSQRHEWTEVIVCGARWRVRVTPKPALVAHPLTELLHPIVEGNRLDTVSRRDSRRLAANVFTDGNCVFRTDDPATLLALLRALRDGRPGADAVSGWLGRRLSRTERNAVVAGAATIRQAAQ
jgi:hypothetical protein